MPNLEHVLATETLKEGGLEAARRVYYTLTAKKELETHRIAKCLGLLVAHLQAHGLLEGDTLDTILLDVTL